MKLNSEIPASNRIPYRAHISENTVVTDAGEYLQVIRLTGASFESADDEDLNNWHQRLNVMFRNIGSPHIMLYQHIVRRNENSYPDGDFEPGSFAAELDTEYKALMAENTLMVNELYLTVMYKPLTSILEKALFDAVKKLNASRKNPFAASVLFLLSLLGLNHKAIEESIVDEQARAKDVLEKTVQEMLIALDRYDPELMGTYEYKYTNPETKRTYAYECSEILEFFGYLINGEWQRYPLPTGPLNEYLPTSRQLFGSESFELWNPDGKIFFGAVLGIKEPPAETTPGFLDQILTLPFPFVVTQSFDFQFKEHAKSKINTQRKRLETSNDDAISQQADLIQALDKLASNEFLFGDHHFNMIVYGNDAKDVQNNLATARAILADSGMVITREDAANEAAFWAQLPGNASLRPRVCSLSSRNFAAFAPLHNFPQGRKDNNHWGPALAVLRASSGSPYYFSLHASDPNDPDGGTKKDIGHCLVLGPTGSGKTVFVAFCQTMLQKAGCTNIALTKDYDTQICIQANGGLFFPLKQGQRTNFNPFALEPTPENRNFTYNLLRDNLLKIRGQEFTPNEEDELTHSLNILWDMPTHTRRLSLLGETLNVTTENGLHKRLQKWINDGEFAWVFDNPTDSLQDTLNTQKNIGFDITSFLDIPAIRTPINMYLFHRINGLMDGRRLALFIAEFWKALDDPALMGFAKDGLKTQRKKNALTVLDSQSPSDALNSAISSTLIEQTATKILFPNPDAKIEEYIDGLNCSEREARLVKEEIEPGSRQFLIKQGRYSVVAQLNLKGMHYCLDVLSSRTANIEIVNALQTQLGMDVNKWLPMFKEKRGNA